MMNDTCMAIETRANIGDKARSASDMLSEALDTANSINSFLFTGESKEGQEALTANCLDEELSLISDKAKMLATILKKIRERL